MSAHPLSEGMAVRVALDSQRKHHAARTGTIQYLGETHARVRFEDDSEMEYWFKVEHLTPAHRVSDPQGGGNAG